MNKLLSPDTISIIVGNKQYTSILHYVYSNVACDKMIEEMEITKGMSERNVNTREFLELAPLKKLQKYFYNILYICEFDLLKYAKRDYPHVTNPKDVVYTYDVEEFKKSNIEKKLIEEDFKVNEERLQKLKKLTEERQQKLNKLYPLPLISKEEKIKHSTKVSNILQRYLIDQFTKFLLIAYDQYFDSQGSKDLLLNTPNERLLYNNNDPYLGNGINNDGFKLVNKILLQFKEKFRTVEILPIVRNLEIRQFLSIWEEKKLREVLWIITCFYSYILIKNNKNAITLNISMVKYVVENICGMTPNVQNPNEIEKSFILNVIEIITNDLKQQTQLQVSSSKEYYITSESQLKEGDLKKFKIVQNLSDELFVYLWDYIYSLRIALLKTRNLVGNYLEKVTIFEDEISKFKFLNEVYLFHKLKKYKFIPEIVNFWICENEGHIILKNKGFTKLLSKLEIKENEWKDKLNNIINQLKKEKIIYNGDNVSDITQTIYYTVEKQSNVIKDLFIIDLENFRLNSIK